MAGLGKLGASMAAAIASRGFDVVYSETLDRLQPAPWHAVEASAV